MRTQLEGNATRFSILPVSVQGVRGVLRNCRKSAKCNDRSFCGGGLEISSV